MEEKVSAGIMVGFIGLILLILSVADVIPGIFSKDSADEAEEAMTVSAESVMSGRFADEYEEYVEETFVGRATWENLQTDIQIMLQKKNIDGIYLGRDGYEIVSHFPDDYPEDLVDAKVTDLAAFSEKYDAFVMLVPTPDNILSDKLPAFAPYFDDISFLADVKNAVGDEHFIDVYDILYRHRDEDLYYQATDQWTNLGAYYGYLAWKEQVGSTSVVTHDRPEFIYDVNTLSQSYYEEEGSVDSFAEIETGYKRGRQLILIKGRDGDDLIPLLSGHYDRIYVIDIGYYSGDFAAAVEDYLTPVTDVMVVCDCIQFLEEYVTADMQEEEE